MFKARLVAEVTLHLGSWEETMKCVALVVFSVILSLRLEGQAPTQAWHPSVAEDNKSATWEDTAAFLNRWALTTAHSGGWAIKESSTENRCKVHLQVKWNGGSLDFHEVSGEIDLAKVDPLTITANVEMRADAPPVSSLTIQGVGNEPFLNGKEAIWQSKYGDRDFSEVGSMTCPADLKEVKWLHSCVVQPVTAYKFILFFDSDDDARRYARALMHASLLCGGTKAVSPF